MWIVYADLFVAGRRTLYSSEWVLRLPSDTVKVRGVLLINGTLYLYRETRNGDKTLMIVENGAAPREYSVEGQRFSWILHAGGAIVNLELVLSTNLARYLYPCCLSCPWRT